MKKELQNLIPSDLELARLSKKVSQAVTSRSQLMSIIDKLDTLNMDLEERMVYALGLVSLGFSQERALDRLNIRDSEFYIWKQLPDHQTMIRNATSRGEMILEEIVLVEAEKNPVMAFKVLEMKEKKRDKQKDREVEKEKNLMDIMKDSARERGIAIDGEIVQDVLT
jgi:hypothetical protein